MPPPRLQIEQVGGGRLNAQNRLEMVARWPLTPFLSQRRGDFETDHGVVPSCSQTGLG